jgi:DNA gyrase subunit A
MLISTGGVLIRTRVNDIRVMGRSTQGVTLINLDRGTFLAGLEKVVETEEGGDGAVEGEDGAESGGE